MRQQLARELPTASQIEKPDTDKDAALPAHQGAAAYIDGNERTFLERYTDYIWGAILVFSGVGSAWAWLQHYWKRDEREQYDEHRDNLLDLIAKVRTAETPEELAEMQGAADELLREALDCYEDGAIEDGDLSVIGLALEQFHHAVADRRAIDRRHGARHAAAAGAARAKRNRGFFPISLMLCARTAPRCHCAQGRRSGGDETVLKQFPNATKPFWRHCANVLKRLTCTGLSNDALELARQGAN